MRLTVMFTAASAALMLSATPSSAWMLPKSLRSTILSPNPTTTATTTTTALSSVSGTHSSSDGHSTTVEEMKADIARMRQEALQRLELLNEQMGQAEVAWKDQKNLEANLVPSAATTTTTAESSLSSSHAAPSVVQAVETSIMPTSNSFPVVPAPHAEDIYAFNEAEQIDALVKARVERDKMHFLDPVVPDTTAVATATTTAVAAVKPTPVSSRQTLNDTRWRLMLNVGRESGTWMPKTWGVSGDRIRLHLELEFSPEQLYEREEFLNGVSGDRKSVV